MQHVRSQVRFIPRSARAFVLLLALFGSLNVYAQATCTSAQGCAFVMLNGMVGGLGKNVENDVWGWAFGGGQASGTAGMVSELGTIETTLQDILTELDAVEQDLKALNCGIDVDLLNGYASGIQSYFQTYQLWVQDMKKGVLPDVDEISEWANCAVGLPNKDQSCAISNSGSVQTMMQALANAAASTAGSTGSIAACVAAGSGQLPQLNTLDDRPWYAANVEPITDWYLTVNVQGLAVLVEAWHFRAWDEAGRPKTDSVDDIYDSICQSGNQVQGCIEPITYYNDVFFGNMKAQMRAGGAPYSTDEHLMLNGNNHYLLARSIEAYEKALDPDNSEGCDTTPGSRTSTAPCGKTVGYYNDTFPSVKFGPYGYGSVDADGNPYGPWVSAPFRAFQVLFNLGFNDLPFSGVSASRFLCTLSSSGGNTTDCLQANGGAGLQVGRKIVQFSDLELNSNFVTNWLNGHALIRFMDGDLKNTTSTQPFAINAYQEIFIKFHDYEDCTLPNGHGAYSWYRSSGTNDSSDPDYYKFNICGRVDNNQALNFGADWIVRPPFDTRNQVRQYRWPVLDWSALTCSDGSSAVDALNKAGMPTLCGADFDAWFESIVPAGPTTSGVSTAADTTLHSTAPNSNDGAGLYLTLGTNPSRGNRHRLVLGFDTVELGDVLAAGEVSGVFLLLTPEPLFSSAADLPRAVVATGASGISISAVPLTGDLIEGDGDLASGHSGTYTGATWNCAEDANLNNNRKECLQRWPNPMTKNKSGVVAQQEWTRGSALIWDVTNHVAEGETRWLLSLDNSVPFADNKGNPVVRYYSREAAEELGEPSLAPRLLVIYND